MLKRLPLILLGILILPLSFVHALNYEVKSNPESKGNQQIFIYDANTESTKSYSINIRFQGTKIEKINFPGDFIYIPTCANGATFLGDQICFDLVFTKDHANLDPIFSVNVQPLKNSNLQVTNIKDYKAIPDHRITLTPTPDNLGNYFTDNILPPTPVAKNLLISASNSPEMPYLLIVAIIILAFVFFVSIRHQRGKYLKGLNISYFILISAFISISLLTLSTRDFVLPETGAPANTSKFDATGCYRDRLLVKYQESLNPDLSKLSLPVLSQENIGDNLYLVKFDIKKPVTDAELDQAVKSAKALPGVAYVDLSCSFTTGLVPNDPDYSAQSSYLEFMNYPAAWDIIKDTTNSKAIAIADSGFISDQNDFANNIWVNPKDQMNGKDDDGNGYIDDVNGWNFSYDNGSVLVSGLQNQPNKNIFFHGTAMAGIIGAETNNNNFVAGSIWKTKMMIFGTGNPSDLSGQKVSMDSIYRAWDYISKHDVWAVNASLSTPQFIQSDYDMAKKLGDKNIIVVAAASNDNSDNDQKPQYPCNFDLVNVICVGALSNTFNGKWNEATNPNMGSNWGKTSVDLFAPGQLITVLNFQGPKSWQVSGTSAAAPFVTAAIGMYRSKYPNATIPQVRAALFGSVKKIPALADLSVTGGSLDVKAFLNTAPPNTPTTTPSNPTPSSGTPTVAPATPKVTVKPTATAIPTPSPTPVVPTVTPVACVKPIVNFVQPTTAVPTNNYVYPPVTALPTITAVPYDYCNPNVTPTLDISNNRDNPIRAICNPTVYQSTIVATSGKCAQINNWTGAGFYCEAGNEPKTVLYCDELRQEIPDKDIACGATSACVSDNYGKNASCSVDRCSQLGDRWKGQSGYYCSNDNKYLISCGADQREDKSQSFMCPGSCSLGASGQPDSCNYTAEYNNLQLFTNAMISQSYIVQAPIGSTSVACGPMDGNKNGVIDIGDFGYLAMVFSTPSKQRKCNDSANQYLPLGPMDSNHDGVVDIIDFENFVRALQKC